MAKPRKKEPTLAELLAQYGRNIASDAPVVGRRIVEGVRSLPEMAAAGNRAMLGATQRISDMLPPVLQMPGIRGDYRPSIDEVTGLARDIATGGNRLVTGTSQRGLDAMGAPRGAGYDPGATRMSRGAQDAIVSGVQALPKQLYDSPLSTAYEAALMAAPVPGKMVGRALEGAGALAGRAMRGRRAAPLAAAVEDVAPMPQGMLALPAPERMLALPAPGPGLPPGAAKLRGGQFWIDRDFDGANYSPEAAARRTRQGDPSLSMLHVGELDPGTGHGAQLGDWLEKTLAKYYKNEFGTPDDPLRALAERGLHYDTEMTPERWQKTVNSYLQEDPIGSVLLPRNPKGGMPGAGDDLRANAMLSMPWLAKQPVTDKIYGIGGSLDLTHFTDEMRNAMAPEASGLPVNLAVRPESLGRMTFPQAVEQVGKINQYRAKEMERAALSSASNPAVQTFKEYSENNPMGLRWTELKTPELNDNLLSDTDRSLMDLTVKEGRTTDPAVLEMVRKERAKTALQDALKYEGDTMGHCVGGYCDDVASGKSRIFSLRDAKGEPHVTIETSPSNKQYFFSDVRAAVGDDQADDWLNEGLPLSDMVERAGLRAGNLPEDIVQIKGKQNRAPKDDYLPFVQDFVKSGQWGNVGDLGNTRLVKLPDGRYITSQQADEGIAAIPERIGPEVYDPSYLHSMDPDVWSKIASHFEGYAVGGRVSADRCFSRHPMSVR
jgi:hypothetical protein